MIGWIILAVYAIGWLGFSVTIARFIVADMDITQDDDGIDRIMPVIMGMLLALFWPLVIPGGWMYKKVFANNKEDK